MTPKERVDAVFAGRPPDKVPLCHMSFSSRIASVILGREAYVGGGINRWREAAARWNGPQAHAEFIDRTVRDAIDIALATDLDLVRPYHWREPRKPSERIDEYTFRYERSDGTWEVKQLDPQTELYNVVDSSPRPEPTLDDLGREVDRAEEAADAYVPAAEDFPEIVFALREVGDTHAIRCIGPWTSIPVDSAAWMEATLLRPDLVGRLLDTHAVRSLKNIELLSRYGGELFFGGGDMASDRGPMYSPRVFRELVTPRLQRISDFCHERGVRHLFGTDGNVWPVAADLYGASGVDGHYEVDRRAGMDILRIHERYPHITMLGNISSFTLHTGTPADVREETRACLEEAKATNKVVAGCSNIIISETPMANVDAMLETLAEHR
ncbi:MAG: uroporphyrinogen decarboxylase family protein [Planctomycetota bacterium]